jgi:hypothetical protein
LLDGFLNRFVVFVAHDSLPPEREVADAGDVPAKLIEKLVTAEKVSDPARRAGTPLAGMCNDPALGSGARVVPESDAAAGFLRALRAKTDERIREMRRGQDPHADLWVRYCENVVKVALVRACGCKPASPIVQITDVEWAAELVQWSTESMVRGAYDRMADNSFERDLKRVRRFVRDAGPSGMSRSDLTRKTQDIGSVRRKDIIETLKASDEVVEVQRKSRGKRSGATVYIAGKGA